MEEEYRNQKAQQVEESQQPGSRTNGVIHEDGSVRDSMATTGETIVADDDASTRGMMSDPEVNNADRGSNESDHVEKVDDEDEAPPSAQAGSMNGSRNQGFDATTSSIHKPRKAAASEADEAEDEERKRELRGSGEPLSMAAKRLCERWLDNMFMCLYEDLRVWTIFRAEVAHFKNNRQAYRKTGSEWEILGDLGTRLLHKEEAKEAYQRCLEIKFSAKAWMRLLEIYADEGDLQRSLNSAIRLTAYQHRWYFEMAFPTSVAHQLYKLGLTHGHQKISFTILSMGLPDGIRKIVEHYLQYAKTFQIEGYDF